MKFVRRAAGYSSWAVAAVMALEAPRPASAEPPKPIGGGPVMKVPEVAIDAGAPINVQVAWLGEPGLFGCSLVAKATPNGLECSGYLPNEAARQKALFIAKHFVGDQIVDRLHIQPGMPISCGTPAAPVDLAPAASTRLAEALGEKVLGLRVVSPSAGRVEVTGTIESAADKLIVSKCLKGLHGCSCVINRVSAPASPGGAAVVTNVPAMHTQPSGPPNPPQSNTAVAFMPGMPPMSATKMVSEVRPNRQLTVEMYVGTKPKHDDGEKPAQAVKAPPRVKEKPVAAAKSPASKPSMPEKPRVVEVAPSAYRPIETVAAKEAQPKVLPPVFAKSESPAPGPMTSKPVISEPLLPPTFGGEVGPNLVARPEMPKPVMPEAPMPVAPMVPNNPIVPVASSNEPKAQPPAIENKPLDLGPMPGRSMITDLPVHEQIKPADKDSEVVAAAPKVEPKLLHAAPPALPALPPLPEIKSEEPRPAPVVPKLESRPIDVIKAPAPIVSGPEIRNGSAVEKPTRIDLIPEVPKPAPVEQPKRIDLIPDSPKLPVMDQPKRIDLIPDSPKPVNTPPAAPKVLDLKPAPPKAPEPAPQAVEVMKAAPQLPNVVPAPLPPISPNTAPTAPGRAVVSDLANSDTIKPDPLPKPAALPKPVVPPAVPEIAKPSATQPDRMTVPAAPPRLKSAAVASAPMIKSTETSPAPAPRTPAEIITKSDASEANIKGVIRQANGNSAIALDSETVRRAVEDVCRGGATEIKVAATGNRQLTIVCKVPGPGDWERLYGRIKSLPEMSGYSLIYNVTTTGKAGGAGSSRSTAPMMGIIRTGATDNVVESDYLRKLVEELCRDRAEDVVVRATAKQQITVGMKVRSAADWDQLYSCIKALPEVAGYAVIYKVTVK